MPKDTTKAGGRPEMTEPPKLGRTVLEDLNQMDFRRTMRQDLEEVYQFYLDAETRGRLDEMDQATRWFHLTGWLLKNSILKLTPVRRLSLLGGIFLFLWGVIGNFPALIFGFLFLLFVLILELKDKLLAQDELMTGRAVQFALMPREHPSLSGWETWLFTRPANEVGGDLVDYLMEDENRLLLALGDVAGKGLGAALYMAKLQSTLRAIAPNYDSLSDLGKEVNTIFLRDGLRDRFISLVYLELVSTTGKVRVLNAGHMPPMVAHDGSVEEMPKGAPALGLMRGSAYEEQHVVLEVGDVLLVYSDGLTEARDDHGQFFGERRLKALMPSLRNLSAEDAGLFLLKELERFTGDAKPSDDLSMMVIKRTASPPALLKASGPAMLKEVSPR